MPTTPEPSAPTCRSAIENLPDGAVLFDAVVPESFSAEYQNAIRRVIVLRIRDTETGANRTQGGVMVFGAEGWHTGGKSKGRDFTASEKSERYGSIVGVMANEGERECVRLLLEERDALAAQVAALRADVARLEGELSPFGQCCKGADPACAGECLVSRRSRITASALASSVPRSVAERAMNVAVLCNGGILTGRLKGFNEEQAVAATFLLTGDATAKVCAKMHGMILDRVIAEAEHAAARQGATNAE